MLETASLLADANGYARRKMVLALLSYALAHALSEAVIKNNDQVAQRRQQGRHGRCARAVLAIIHAAKEKGFAIDKFF